MSPTVRIKPDTAEVIDQLGGTFDSPDDVIKELLKNAGHKDKFERTSDGEVVVQLRNQGQLDREFRLGPGSSQIDVMVGAVEYLIDEYDLLNNIDMPYSRHGNSKTLINDEPVRQDGDEMNRYRNIAEGYYLNVLYSKDAKVARLRDLANKCGLDLKPAGSWAE